MASLEVDTSSIEPGNTITVKWRGKPVFVKHRTEEEISKAKDEDFTKLRDPESDDDRSQKPEVSLYEIRICNSASPFFACITPMTLTCLCILSNAWLCYSIAVDVA